ncbi:exported protein of unknown function [Pararobbsia alpina]
MHAIPACITSTTTEFSMKAFRILSMLVALFAASATLTACQSDGMNNTNSSSGSGGSGGSGAY